VMRAILLLLNAVAAARDTKAAGRKRN
jgi:hypothetical protein